MIGLTINNLSFAYADRVLIKNANLNIESKGITGITGSNGCGKSTLLRLMHGLIKPNSGHIQWIGTKISPRIGMVFQKSLMLRRSVLANIKFALKFSMNEASPFHYLQQLDLAHLAKKHARTLSGGEQQKLEIARVFALQPDIILLDEPTAHLDKDSTLKIEKLLIELSQQGAKIFLVSHDANQIQRLAEDVIHIEAGKLEYK